jgi:hypothetical protein
MARRMFEFKCSEEHITESFVDYETTQILCDCGLEAHRIISTPRISLDGTNPDFVSAYDRWARVREEKAKKEAKRNEA